MLRWLIVPVLWLATVVWSTPVHILATGDMHGWVEAQPAEGQVLGGAAEMLAYWQRVEHYTPKQFLVISCGDNFTGPAISTAFQGQPVVEAMTRMGYDVSVVGNHEFDFGRARMLEIFHTSPFPYLAANLQTADGAPCTLAAPYTIYTEQGVKVGIIGLSPVDLASLASTDGVRATAYVETLRRVVPEVRAKGADVVIVAAHASFPEMVQVARQVQDLDIPLIFGAHDHTLAASREGHTWVLNNGEWWHAYSRVDLEYNPATHRTVTVAEKQVWLQQQAPKADPTLAAIVAHWKGRLADEYERPVAYSATGVARTAPLYNFIVDCWLAQHPTADAALSNLGGFRQDIPAGVVTRGVILGVMPFNNALYNVRLTGAELLAYLAVPDNRGGLAGLRRADNGFLVLKTGQPVDPAAVYHVLLNSFMYQQSPALRAADPHPATAAADWRHPVLDWLAAHPTSKEKPLETLVDGNAR